MITHLLSRKVLDDSSLVSAEVRHYGVFSLAVLQTLVIIILTGIFPI